MNKSKKPQTTTKIGKKLEVMSFARLVSNKALREYDFKAGDEVLVVSFKNVQDNASDPYNMREYALVAKVTGEEVQIPGEKNDYKVYLVDPRNFEPVSEERQQELEGIIRKQYEGR